MRTLSRKMSGVILGDKEEFVMQVFTNHAALGVFCNDGKTGDGMGVSLLGMYLRKLPMSSAYDMDCGWQIVFACRGSHSKPLTPWCVWSGGERILRELMAITGATAQELVTIVSSSFGALGGAVSVGSGSLEKARAAAAASGRSDRPVDRTVSDIAVVVMGHDAWDTYKNHDPGSMKGPRRPHFRTPTEKRVTERRKTMGGGLRVEFFIQN